MVELLNSDQEEPLEHPSLPPSPDSSGLKDEIDHLQKNINNLLDNDFFQQMGGVDSFPEFDLEPDGGAFLKEVEETPNPTHDGELATPADPFGHEDSSHYISNDN